MTNFRKWAMAIGLAAALLPVGAVLAQDYPTKPITIVAPYPPGASIDQLARLTADMLSKQMGATVVVQNVPGAGSILGTRQVAGADADGYTLLLGTSAMISNLFGVKDPGYTMDDFTAIGPIGYSGFVLLTNTASSGAANLEEFLAYGLANPGKLKFGTTGGYSTQTLLASNLADSTQLQWREVPFQGAADEITALLAGEIDAVFLIPNMVLPVQDQTNIEPMAISDVRRDVFLPEVPTFDEKGVAGVNGVQLYTTLLAPAGTPEPVIEKLRAAFAAGMQTEEMKAALVKAGVGPFPEMTRPEFDAFVASYIADTKATFDRLGIQPQ